MRLLLVGAFAFPHHQGSQVYFREQALALREAGADVELLTYASGRRDPDQPAPQADEFVHHTASAWSAPRSLRSGPSWRKPIADADLAMTLRQRVASQMSHNAYDAVLTHNAEAGLAAVVARVNASASHVYCPHTLLGQELSTYAKSLKLRSFSSDLENRSMFDRGLDAVGRRIDRSLARRADGWIALTPSSHRIMRQSSTQPGERIAPPLSDPRAATAHLDPLEVAARHGLVPGEFYLYAGNQDGYQELELLGTTAAILADAIADPQRRPSLVVASHDSPSRDRVESMPGIEFRQIDDAPEMLALLGTARASLVTRRIEGGFPIKLANALGVGTPPIAFHAREWGLTDGQDALIGKRDRPAASLASAILRLSGEDALRSRLSLGARQLYERQHRPDRVAQKTLELLEKVIGNDRSEATRTPRDGR